MIGTRDRRTIAHPLMNRAYRDASYQAPGDDDTFSRTRLDRVAAGACRENEFARANERTNERTRKKNAGRKGHLKARARIGITTGRSTKSRGASRTSARAPRAPMQNNTYDVQFYAAGYGTSRLRARTTVAALTGATLLEFRVSARAHRPISARCAAVCADAPLSGSWLNHRAARSSGLLRSP